MEIVAYCRDCPLKKVYTNDCGITVSKGKSATGLSIVKVPDNRCKLKYRKEHKGEEVNSIWMNGKRI